MQVFANVTFSAAPTTLRDNVIESCVDFFSIAFSLWSPQVATLQNLNLADVRRY